MSLVLPVMNASDVDSSVTPLATQCVRTGPVSGTYYGESTTAPAAGQERALELRVDIDRRYPNSPVLGVLSGDIFQVQRLAIPGQPKQTWRVYLESWIARNPVVTWKDCHVEITGRLVYWRGIRTATTVTVRIPWRTSQPVGPAVVTIPAEGGQSWGFTCTRLGDWFREINMEVDVCQSVATGIVQPTYDTSTHPDQPADLPARTLTIEEGYREAGVRVRISSTPSVIDDSAANFKSWSAAELHDAMERHFSLFGQPWPSWKMWGLLAGTYDNPGVGGIMFDAAAANGGAGRSPDRQGFAVFKSHSWFSNLKTKDAEALRKYLYTWIHEMGHAFNFLHSWDKNRPDALSWMNYDWKYDANHGSKEFWKKFYMRFDDEELTHLRHGNRPAVMMGGDPWASGGHAESPAAAEHLHTPPGAMAELEGRAPLELQLRSKGFYAFLEPVEVEFRLRNLLDEIPLKLDVRMSPEYGGTTVYIRRPDGRVVEYDPIFCMIAESHPTTLDVAPRSGEPEGADRYSESVFLSYGKYGFYFDTPGEYLVRAVYRGGPDLLIPSNMLRIRVGTPMTADEDRLGQDFFSYQVGMSLYLKGSHSPFLSKGMDTLREATERVLASQPAAAASLVSVIAKNLSRPFHRIGESGAIQRTFDPAESTRREALAVTQPVLEAFHDKSVGKAQNLAYRSLVNQRVENHCELGETKVAKAELSKLHTDLANRGANPIVLDSIQSEHDQLSDKAPRARSRRTQPATRKRRGRG